MRADVVLFDLGGTVCRFMPERRLMALARDSGLAPEEVHARIWGSGFDAECDRGRYTAAEVYQETRRRLGLRMDFPAFRAAWAAAFEPDPDMLSIAEGLQGRTRVALLTDNGPVLREAMPACLPEVARRFDPLLFSCDLGACKPEREIFLRAAARLGTSAARILLIDDSAVAVAGAEQAGLAAVRFTGAAALRRMLHDVMGKEM